MILAYFPLGHGKLASAMNKMRDICERYGKTPAQVALNWLASKPNVIPIPRASRASHVKENLGASGWELSQDDKSQVGENLRTAEKNGDEDLDGLHHLHHLFVGHMHSRMSVLHMHHSVLLQVGLAHGGNHRSNRTRTTSY